MERKEIFRDRKSIEEFGVDTNNTINKALFDVLFQIEYITSKSEMEETLLGLFNDAYYICTLILLEKRPYFKMQRYKDIASGCEEFFLAFNTERAIIVMSMVSVYLKSLDIITDDINKTIGIIHADYSSQADKALFERIVTNPDITEFTSIKATEFYPLHFPEKEECSHYWETYRQAPGDLAKIAGMMPSGNDQNAKELVAALEAKMAKLTEQAAQREQEVVRLVSENAKLKRRAEEFETQHKLLDVRSMEEMAKQLEASKIRCTQLEEVNHRLESWFESWQHLRDDVAQAIYDPNDIAAAGGVDDPSVMENVLSAIMSNYELEKENERLRAQQEAWRESEEYQIERNKWEKTSKQRIDVQDFRRRLLEYAKTYTESTSEQLRYFVQVLNEILRKTPWDAVSDNIVVEALAMVQRRPTVEGDYIMGNKNIANQVNGVADGATGIIVNKDNN